MNSVKKSAILTGSSLGRGRPCMNSVRKSASPWLRALHKFHKTASWIIWHAKQTTEQTNRQKFTGKF